MTNGVLRKVEAASKAMRTVFLSAKLNPEFTPGLDVGACHVVDTEATVWDPIGALACASCHHDKVHERQS